MNVSLWERNGNAVLVQSIVNTLQNVTDYV